MADNRQADMFRKEFFKLEIKVVTQTWEWHYDPQSDPEEDYGFRGRPGSWSPDTRTSNEHTFFFENYSDVAKLRPLILECCKKYDKKWKDDNQHECYRKMHAQWTPVAYHDQKVATTFFESMLKRAI